MVTYNVPFMEVIFIWHSDHSVGRQTIHWVRWSRAHPLRLGCGDCTGLRSLLICSLTKILLTLITIGVVPCYAVCTYNMMALFSYQLLFPNFLQSDRLGSPLLVHIGWMQDPRLAWPCFQSEDTTTMTSGAWCLVILITFMHQLTMYLQA